MVLQRIKHALSFVDRQACFNIGLSFLSLSLASQVYSAKLERISLEQKVSQATSAMLKMDRVVVDESQSDKDLRRAIRVLLAEARGEAPQVEDAAEVPSSTTDRKAVKPGMVI